MTRQQGSEGVRDARDAKADKAISLKLWFSGEPEPQLAATEFKHPSLREPHTAGLLDPNHGFKWSRGVQALAAYLLRWAAWGLRRQRDPRAAEPVLEGKRGSPAATLNDALTKDSLCLKDIFAASAGGTSLFAGMVTRRNRDFKRVAKNPVTIEIAPNCLPPECVEVYVDDEIESSPESLDGLAEKIERRCWPGRSNYTWSGKPTVARRSGAEEERRKTPGVSSQPIRDVPLSLPRHVISFDSFIEERTRDFVGPDFLFAAIRSFLDEEDSGYFIIEGEPGIGKSAIMAWLVRESDVGCPVYHFNIASQGINSSRQFLSNICARLITHFGLPYADLPGDVCVDSSFLSKLLEETAGKLSKDAKLLIAVDALDEADPAVTTRGEDPLLFPISLPPKVHVVATSRPGWEKRFRLMHAKPFPLDPDEEGNRKDVREYVEWQAEHTGIKEWVAEHRSTAEKFASIMVEKSEGNFIYLHYVLREMEHGAYRDSDIDGIPSGLQNYYEDHWRRMGMMTRPLPRAKLKVIDVLCETRKPVSCELLSDFAGEDPLVVQAVLDDWLQFLDTTMVREAKRYSVYHSRVRDVLHRKDIVRAAGIRYLI